MARACPRCGLPLGQEEGAFLGSMALNYGVAGVIFLGILIGTVIATAPKVPVVPLRLDAVVGHRTVAEPHGPQGSLAVGGSQAPLKVFARYNRGAGM